ncbi:condensation domain-containing protein [Streptomyces sp. NPDC001680]
MIPVSFGQHRLWLLDRFERTGWTYNIVVRARITGQLDVAALDAAVSDVVARHEALRTSFPDVDGTPHQHIAPADRAAVRLHLADLPDDDLATLDADGRHVFDLTGEPPVRAVLFRVSEQRFVLQLVFHHIVVDGWSVRPLMRDLAGAYEARRAGAQPGWEPLPVQFADFALWQRDVLGSADDPSSLLSAQLDFWRSALAGLPAEIALPTDRERPQTATFRGGAIPFTTDAGLHRRLREVAYDCGATLFMVVHAALAALWHRLGAGDDIPVGTVTAGRADESLNDLVGFFVNTLALRADVSGNPTFRELIARVRDFDLDAFDHQDAPFDEVVHDLAPVRRPGRHPLFQTMLAIQSHEPAEPGFAGLSVEMEKAESIELHSAKFDLYFDLAETWEAAGVPAGVQGHLVYAADLWDEWSAQAISRRLTAVLEALAADPDARVLDPELVLDGERALLTGEAGAERTGQDEAAVRARWDAPPVAGGHLVTAGPDAEPARIAELVRDRDATVLALPTTALITLSAEHPSVVDGLRDLVVGGGLPPVEVLSGLLDDHPRLRILYAPAADSDRTLRILDSLGRLVPLGVFGELHISAGATSQPTGLTARRRTDGWIEFPRRSPDTFAPIASPGARAASGSGGSARPRTAAQEILCGIFADVLGVESVGIHDDFFDLGGHSLLAVRVASRVRRLFDVELDLSSVFRASSVAKLDVLIRRSAQGARLAPLRVAPRPEPLPLSPAQLRLWMLDQIQGPSASYNVPVALRLRGDLDAAALGHAVKDVMARHEALRTVFPDDLGEPYQYTLSARDACIELQRSHCSETDLPEALTAYFGHVFHLDEGPLVRAHLIEVGPDDHVFLFVMHHIVSDGWSIAPLLRDLAAAYTARHAGHAPSWPVDEPLQYADYALWQLTVLGDPADKESLAARQLGYWREALAGLPEEVTLPPDRPRPAGADASSDTVTVLVDRDLHRGLAHVARETGTTLFMVLHAAFAVLLARLGAGHDIPIGTPVAGRADEAFDDLVGFLTNTVVLRTDVSQDIAFREFLGHVRDADLGALGHQDVPFDQVVQELNPPRSVSRNPLFQIGFALEHHTPLAFAAPGLAVETVQLRGVTAKLDLDLTLIETRDGDGEPGGITGTVEFPAALYDVATVVRAVEEFQTVLRAVVGDPEVHLSELGVPPSA